MPTTAAPRKSRHDELRLRMLGQNVRFARHQWEELLDSLAPGSDLAVRVARMLEES